MQCIQRVGVGLEVERMAEVKVEVAGLGLFKTLRLRGKEFLGFPFRHPGILLKIPGICCENVIILYF